MAVVYCQLRYFHYKSPKAFVLDEPQEILDLRREILIWENAAKNMLTACSRDEDLIKETLSRKIANLAHKLNHKIVFAETSSNEQYRHTLIELQAKVSLHYFRYPRTPDSKPVCFCSFSLKTKFFSLSVRLSWP